MSLLVSIVSAVFAFGSLAFSWFTRKRLISSEAIALARNEVMSIYHDANSALISDGEEAFEHFKSSMTSFSKLNAYCEDELSLGCLASDRHLKIPLIKFYDLCVSDDLVLMSLDEAKSSGRYEKMRKSRKDLVSGLKMASRDIYPWYTIH